MGGAISVAQAGQVPKSSHAVETFTTGEVSVKRRKNKQVFERTVTVDDFTLDEVPEEVDIDDVTRKLLTNAMEGFFFLQSDENGESSEKINLLIRAMEKEEFPQNYCLITEGESGSKLYVVENGELEVSINGEIIRQLGKGALLGELALLYDAPRTATVKCTTSCVLWSLKRDFFKKIQAMSATTAQLERCRALINSPELAILSPIELSRLAGVLQPLQYNSLDLMFKQGDITKNIILIEKGHIAVYSTIGVNGKSSEDIDKTFCILKSRIESSTDMVEYNDRNLSREVSEMAKPYGKFVCRLGPGCIIGIGALRGKAGLEDGWKWVKNGDVEGSECPFTGVVDDSVQAQLFTVDAFENLFGSAAIMLMDKKKKADDKKAAKEEPAETEIVQFDSTKFKMKCVLGSGSFGVVLLAEYRHSGDSVPTLYALKSLSKFTVLETGQLRHVMDERKILAMMKSHFVLRLFGTYQTPHQLVMVTEALQFGDLWSVIYETSPYCDNGGLSRNLTIFYTAVLILALDHVHGKGIVFRDLKPENIMMDSLGYLRIIDFGFSKIVPYTKVDANGVARVFPKTYTLCGTPEYLSPELIFNLGHDQSCDLWALGVLVHEMILAVTPFAPKKPDNVTELFTNIAMVKVSITLFRSISLFILLMYSISIFIAET